MGCELPRADNSSYESNMIPKQRNLPNTFKEEQNDKGKRAEMEHIQLYGLFFFLTSALVVFYHKRHRKPQKITVKKKTEKARETRLFIESPDGVNVNLKLEKQNVMSQEVKPTFQGVFLL